MQYLAGFALESLKLIDYTLRRALGCALWFYVSPAKDEEPAVGGHSVAPAGGQCITPPHWSSDLG